MKRLAPYLHILWFLFFISGIFWIKWYYLLVIVLALRIQDLLIGGCILTKWQHGSYERRWIDYRFIRWSRLPERFWGFIIDWLFPLLLVLAAYLIQR